MSTREQIEAIAVAANAVRPDWPVKSLVTYLTKSHASRPYSQLLMAVMAIAADPVTKNPARLAENGPWWKAAHLAATGEQPTETPGPGAEPACNRVGHEHELARNCRACAAERHADTEASEAPMVPVEPPTSIVEMAERYRAKAGAPESPERRSFDASQPLRQPDPFNVTQCARAGCGGWFVRDDAGVASHEAVFGHLPVFVRAVVVESKEVSGE